MLSRVPIEHPNSVYRADSAQMFTQTQNDGKNKLNRVYMQMRCGVINMGCHTAVVWCELYSSKTFKNISRAGIMARTQDHLKCECQNFGHNYCVAFITITNSKLLFLTTWLVKDYLSPFFFMNL